MSTHSDLACNVRLIQQVSGTGKLTRLSQGRCNIHWWSGIVVSVSASINEVNLRRAQLVLRWSTVLGVQFLVPDIYFGI